MASGGMIPPDAILDPLTHGRYSRPSALTENVPAHIIRVVAWQERKSISTNGANRPTQRPRVRNVWRCHWLSKGRAKTKQITSQTWARLDVSGGGPLLWHASIPTDALQRISMTARSSRNCLKPRVTLSIGFRGPNREPGVGQTTRGVSKQACLEWRCRSSSRSRAIPRGHHEMH